ncbi:hypothetical protein HETIRDRAFT_331801, partial [Heterobasidion irregulare TC 32-1]
EMEQLDVKTTFLHGGLKEKIWIKQMKGFAKPSKKDQICFLYKRIYNLKESMQI